MVERDTTHIRIKKEVKAKLEDFQKTGDKTPSEKITYLLDIEKAYREQRQELQAQERDRIGLEMLESQV